MVRGLRNRAEVVDARAALYIERALQSRPRDHESPQALRRALEHRLLTRSNETGIGLDRLRRRVLFERVIARLQAAEPGSWVLKGAWHSRFGCEMRHG